MIDLSPPSLRRIVTKERFRRFAVVGVIGFAVVFMYAWALLLPSFFLLVFEQKEFMRQRLILEQTLELQRSKEIEQELSFLDFKARSIIENEERIYKIAPILVQVLRMVGADVSLSALSLRESAISGIAYVVDISGSATSRDRFLEFVNSLKSKKDFLVESPLANVLKEKEVDFKVIVSVKHFSE